MTSDKKLRLSALIDEGYSLRSPNNWPTYTGGFLDRSQYVSSSEIEGCARKIKFSKETPPAPFTDWGHAERGHMIEAWAVNLIREALQNDDEWRLLHAGERQVSFHEGYQSGTPDGLLVNNEDQYAVGVEFKSVHPLTNFNNLPKKKAVSQVQQNMDLMTRQTPYVVTATLLIYIEAANLQRRSEFVIPADKEHQSRLSKRAEWIVNTPVEELPAEGMVIDKECSMCAYINECNALIRDTKEMKQAERATQNVFKI